MPKLSEQESALYKLICTKILTNQPIAVSRWGDGEWYAVEAQPGHNCDYCDYNIKDELGQSLSDRLNHILKTPKLSNYFMLSQRTESCYSLESKFPHQNWQSGNIFHSASIDNQLHHLFNALKSVSCVVYIGNPSLSKLPFISHFIPIPEKNVFAIYQKKLLDIISTFEYDELLVNRHTLYLFSAGMAANVFVEDLYNLNPYNSYIDVGSVFDPYVGKPSRGYHHSLSIDKQLMSS